MDLMQQYPSRTKSVLYLDLNGLSAASGLNYEIAEVQTKEKNPVKYGYIVGIRDHTKTSVQDWTTRRCIHNAAVIAGQGKIAAK